MPASVDLRSLVAATSASPSSLSGEEQGLGVLCSGATCDERGEASGRLSVSDKASFNLLRRDYVLYTVPVNFMPTNHLLIG